MQIGHMFLSVTEDNMVTMENHTVVCGYMGATRELKVGDCITFGVNDGLSMLLSAVFSGRTHIFDTRLYANQ